MRVFLTGANGFIGAKLVAELIGAGHQVLGLTRSTTGAQRLKAAGAKALHGDLEDLASLRAGAAGSDGVIHTAFDHDFAHYLANCEKDRRAIDAIGEALEDSNRPFVITSTTLFGEAHPGVCADEDVFNAQHKNPRVISEIAAQGMIDRGRNVSLVRLSQIHDTARQGLVTFLIQLARETGRSAYIADTDYRWSAAPVSATVTLYRLALEKQAHGARYHATAEEGVSVRAIAERIGQTLGLPVTGLSEDEAMAHFGWLYGFVSKDMTASSQKTQQRLGWQPIGASLLSDIDNLSPQVA